MATKILIPVTVDATALTLTFANGDVFYPSDYAQVVASEEGKPEEKLTKSAIDELIALKKGGFTADEIIELKQSKLL
jgi:hypothetical protein